MGVTGDGASDHGGERDRGQRADHEEQARIQSAVPPAREPDQPPDGADLEHPARGLGEELTGPDAAERRVAQHEGQTRRA